MRGVSGETLENDKILPKTIEALPLIKVSDQTTD